jgi:O-antigen/teichoic acid export membrane protein
LARYLSAVFGDVTTEREIVSAIGLRRLSLKSNFSWTLAGNLVYAACQWGMLVVIAKLGSPQLVGQFALGLAVTAPVMMLCNLQLRAVLATDASEEHPFGDYLTLRLLTTGLALLAVAGIVLAVGYQRRPAFVILAVALTKGFESISDITYGLLQHHERMDRIARSMILRGVSAVVALWLGIHFTGSLLIGCLGVAAGWALILVTYDLSAARRAVLGSLERGPISCGRDQLRATRTSLYHLALLAAPLGVVMMLSSLNVNIPRYVIQHYSGERSLGVFAAVAYVMVAGAAVVNALGQSASPRLAQHYARGNAREFWRLLLRMIAIAAGAGAAGVLVAIIFGREILSTLFRPEYAAAAKVFVWMATAASISYIASFFGYGLTAARRFNVQAPLFVAVALATAGAAIALVPRHGLAGAAWSVLFGALVQLTGSGLILWHETRSHVERLHT